jgi:hypothetical protein
MLLFLLVLNTELKKFKDFVLVLPKKYFAKQKKEIERHDFLKSYVDIDIFNKSAKKLNRN